MELGNFLAASQLSLPTSKRRTVHSNALVVLLGYPKVGKYGRHDSSRIRTWNQRILAEVLNALMIAQEILIQEAMP